MKKKFKLLSVISALLIGSTMALTACGKGGVASHDHIWDEGAVTKESTCYYEGIRTYSCTFDGCKQTKTEPIAMKAHSWNSGEVTTAPTCDKEGVKTYKCTVEGCGKEKQEAVDKIAHIWNDGEITKIPEFYQKGIKTYTCEVCDETNPESVAAHADFAEQFRSSASESNNWLYGYSESFNTDTYEAEFKGIDSPTEGVWQAEGVKIGKGYVYSENYAVIAYSFTEEVPELVQAEVSVSFSGEESNTVLNAYLMITDKDGEVKGMDILNSQGAKDWSYHCEEAVDIAKDDTFWLLFVNEGTGKAGGSLAITFKAPCLHIWDSGTVDKAATCIEKGVMKYSCLNNCDAFKTEEIGFVDHSYDGGRVTKEPKPGVAGETTYTCTVEGCGHERKEEIPALPLEKGKIANFAEDFTLDSAELGNWEYGYATDYVWSGADENKFAFHKIETVDGGKWTDGDGIKISADSITNNSDGRNATVRYTLPEMSEIKISVRFTGVSDKTRITGRLNVIRPDGSVQLFQFLDGRASNSWSHETAELTVYAGTSVSVLFFNEGSEGDFEGTLSFEITGAVKPHTHTEETIHGYPASCTQPGLTDGVKCSDCGQILVPQTEIVATGHKGEWTYDNSNTTREHEFHIKKCENANCPGEEEACDIIATPHRDSCEEEGTVTRECSHCRYTHDDVLEAGQHSWDNGVITVEPTLTSEGKKTVHCNNCDATDENVVVPAKQSTTFEGDFKLNNDGLFAGWEVGVVSYEWGAEHFGFTKITTNSDGAYRNSSPWIEIHDTWMASNEMMAFAYHFYDSASVTVVFNMHCRSADGRYSLRWAVKDSEGNIKNADGKAEWGGGGKEFGHDIAFNKNITVKAGDVLYLLVEKNAGGDQSDFDITLTKAYADFGSDFAAVLAGEETNWECGTVNFVSDSEFTLNAFGKNEASGDMFHSNDPWIDFKGDWAAAREMVGISYTFKQSASIKFNFNIQCSGDGQCAVRWAVKDKDGNFKYGSGANWGGNGASVNISETISVEEGDVLYILISYEGGGDQKTFGLTLFKED